MSRFVFFLAVVLAGSLTIFSQSPASRSSITGLVSDQTGATIIGATCELIGAGNNQQSATTDQSGRFEFKRVASGKYQVRVTSSGFEPNTIDIVVGSQPLAPLQVVLAIASLRQETTVTSAPAQITTEASDNKDTVALSEQSLSQLPVFDKDYIGAMSRFLDPGSVGTSGVTLIVNGMEVNNPGRLAIGDQGNKN